MIQMEGSNSVDVAYDFRVQDTSNKPIWHSVPLTTEDNERVIKVEPLDTGSFDECTSESRIDITKDNDHQNSTEVPLTNQNVPENNPDLNGDYTNHNQTFSCDICKSEFALHDQLKRHIEKQHKKPTQLNFNANQCKFCGIQFKLKFVLNRHIEQNHSNKIECEICKSIVERSVFNQHIQTHECDSDTKINSIPHLKLSKLNGVWKSKHSNNKCKICFQKFDSLNHLIEHKKMHENNVNNIQIQNVDELNGHLQLLSNNQFNCPKCNLRFDSKQLLSIHVSHCTKSSQNIWSKFRGQVKTIIQTSYVCKICGTSYTNPLLLRHHLTFDCKNCSCKYCGKTFNSKELWSKHMDEFQKYKNCNKSNANAIETSANILHNQNVIVNDINQNVNNENSVCTDVIGRNSPDIIDIGSANSNKSTVQTVSCILPANDSGVNLSYENSQGTNFTIINNSDQTETDTVSSIESVQSVLENSSVNNFIMNIKKEKGLCSNTAARSSLNQIDATNSNRSIVQSVSPYNSVVNGFDVNVKKEKNSWSITPGINNFDQIHTANNSESIAQTMNTFSLNIKKEKILSMENSTSSNGLEYFDETGSVDSTVLITSRNPIMNIRPLNIKKEKCLPQNVNENNSSDLLDIVPHRIHELNVQTVPEVNMVSNIRIKREPEDNHDSICTVKEAKYFSIKKLPSNQNISFNFTTTQNLRQTSDCNIIYVCTICKTSSVDLHSFALHMSSHLECSMHECVVCDQTFLTVLLWKNHMTFHQHQVDLNLLNPEINSLDVEPYTNITSDLESMEPVAHSSTLRNKENNFPELNIDFRDSPTSNINTVNKRVQKYKKSYGCDICNIIFPSKLTLMTHQTLHNESIQFCCKFCDRTFSSRGPCTNHEKSHDPNGYKNAVKGINQSIETQNNIPIENNHIINANPILATRKKKKALLKSKCNVCYICRKRFAKSCYLTNHLKLRHRVNPETSKEHVANSRNSNAINNINGNKSLNECKKMELPTVPDTNSFLFVDRISNNTISEIPCQQNSVTSPMTSHVNKIYTCQYCSKQFNQKSSHSNHIKCHQNIREKNKSINKANTVKVKIERNEEHQQQKNGNNSEFDNSSFIEPSITNSTMTAALTDHVTTHSNHGLHKCRFCNRTFLKKSSHSNHIKSHSHKKVKRVKSKNLNVINIETNGGHQQEENLNVSDFNCSLIEPNIAILAKKNLLWFPCDACEKKFSTPFLLVVHRRSHCIEPYLCKICNKSYTVRHRWNRHLKSHYWRNLLKNKSNNQTNASESATNALQPKPVQQQNQLKCGYCKNKYYSISQWKKHMSLNRECRRHCKSSLPEFTTNEARENFSRSTRFECHICKKTYSTLYNRKVHLLNVHNFSNVDLETSASTDVVEQKNIIKTENIQQNSKSVNQKKRRLLVSSHNSNQCYICGKSYSNRANLYRHQTISHSMEANVVNCTICNRSFKHKYSYREHLRSKHSHLLEKNTRHTAKDGKKSRPLMKNKSDIAQYLCKICKVEFCDDVALQNHIIKIHTRKQYACVDCGQKFETNAILGEHILNSNCASTKLNGINLTGVKKTSQPINDNLQCKICFKVVTRAWYLKVHMRIHSGAKPFKCDVCDMTFRFKPNLRIHKRKHNRPKPSS